MDNLPHQLFSTLFANLWWVVLIFIGIGLLQFFKPYLKGKFGELAVSSHVKRYLKEDYILLNNCTLPDDRAGTTQIDHILISPYGIFVIETKNFKGWIFGGERQKNWTQQLYKKRYTFQNPLHQNYKHEKVLRTVLEDLVDIEHIHSVIVFMPDCEFKTQMPANVFKGASWVDYVKSFDTEVINRMRMQRIRRRIEKEVLEKSWKTDRIHIENLKKRKEIS